MPEALVREELEILRIHVQRVVQLQSDRRDPSFHGFLGSVT
jgi:hypothetical protein